MTHLIVVKDKQRNTGAWLQTSDGKHVGYIHDMQDALAIVHAYNLTAPVTAEVMGAIIPYLAPAVSLSEVREKLAAALPA